MTKEQIEKAANDYIGFPQEIDEGVGTTMRRKAFRDGADWRIESVWHEASEMPKQGEHIVVVMKSGNFTSWFVTPDIMDVFKKFNVILWARSKDLLPERKEETE